MEELIEVMREMANEIHQIRQDIKELRGEANISMTDILNARTTEISSIVNRTVQTTNTDNKEEKLPEGMYKVGVDIQPGEYKLIALNGDGFFKIIELDNGKEDIVECDDIIKQKYVKIVDGQFIQFHDAYLML